MHDVENVVNDAAFWTALVLATVGTAFTWWRVRAGAREPGVLVVLTVACLVGLRVEHRLPASLVVGLVLLLVGDWITRELPVVWRLVGALLGALVLGAALPDGWPFWMRAVVAATTLIGGALVEGAERAVPRPVPLLLAIGAVGVYLCVPDTEAPRVLMGALFVGALLGLEPRVRATVGATTLTGLFVWIAGFAGLGRSGSVVGGIASLGVLLLVPLLGQKANTAVLVVTQCALVFFVARVAGSEDSAWAAFAWCVPAFAIGAVVIGVASARTRESEPE